MDLYGLIRKQITAPMASKNKHVQRRRFLPQNHFAIHRPILTTKRAVQLPVPVIRARLTFLWPLSPAVRITLLFSKAFSHWTVLHGGQPVNVSSKHFRMVAAFLTPNPIFLNLVRNISTSIEENLEMRVSDCRCGHLEIWKTWNGCRSF